MGPLWAAAPTPVGHELLLTESLYEDSAQGSGGGGGGGGVRVCRPQAAGHRRDPSAPGESSQVWTLSPPERPVVISGSHWSTVTLPRAEPLWGDGHGVKQEGGSGARPEAAPTEGAVAAHRGDGL